jgi:hypothetical protein
MFLLDVMETNAARVVVIAAQTLSTDMHVPLAP